MEAKRDSLLDIAKAICISLMVLGHSGCPDYLHDFIYMFHMPCFFFISGCLLNDKYISDIKTGLLRKTKGSYYPFVKWTLIFLLFHNLFAACHIYESSYSLRTFAERIVRAFTMTGSESLLGGFWFLISLFWASVFSLLTLYGLNKRNRLNTKYIMGGVISLLLITALWKYIPVNLPQMFGEQTLLATAFYLSGYTWHKMNRKINRPLFYGVLLLSAPAVAAIFLQLDMWSKGWKVFVVYLIAMTGILGVIGISKALAKCSISNTLEFIGSKTLYILVFHFLAFKLVSFIYLMCNDMPIELLTQFPVLKEANGGMWLAYTLVGITLPLFIWKLFDLARAKSARLLFRE